MHRTQILLEDDQYDRLKAESARTGRSLGELVRAAVEEAYGREQEARELRDALRDAAGAWADRALDGEAYVEGLRRGLGRRLADLGAD